MAQPGSGPPQIEEKDGLGTRGPSGRWGAVCRGFWPKYSADYTIIQQPAQECLGSG